MVFAEDIYFKVIEATPAWENIDFPKPSNISREIPQGSIVEGDSGVQFSTLEGVFENIPFQPIIYNEKLMLIYANSIIPLETQDLFDENVLYNPERNMLSSIYMKALRSNNREIIYLHNKLAFDECLVSYREMYQEEGDWWTYAGVYNNLIITQTALTFNSLVKNDSHLLIKSIEKTKDGYVLTVKESNAFQRGNKWWNWPRPEARELFTILLIPDGDYVDLYLDNKSTLIDTFVLVNRDFIIQVRNLVSGNSVDLSRVSWPRRADGSTDYSTPPITSVLEEEKQSELIELSVDTENQQAIQNTPKTSSIPLWALFAIIGGVVVVGGAVVFILKRKK
jgi:hypothetical protein